MHSWVKWSWVGKASENFSTSSRRSGNFKEEERLTSCSKHCFHTHIFLVEGSNKLLTSWYAFFPIITNKGSRFFVLDWLERGPCNLHILSNSNESSCCSESSSYCCDINSLFFCLWFWTFETLSSLHGLCSLVNIDFKYYHINFLRLKIIQPFH